MVRGPYGYKITAPKERHVHILAGGTGAAVVPELYRFLMETGRDVRVWTAGRNSEELGLMKDTILKDIPVTAVPDVKGECAMMTTFADTLSAVGREELKDTVFYNIGPLPFMERASGIQRQYGVSASSIFLSIESRTMCGVGLCGECACGETLTCQEGTFRSLSCLENQEVDLREIYNDHKVASYSSS